MWDTQSEEAAGYIYIWLGSLGEGALSGKGDRKKKSPSTCGRILKISRVSVDGKEDPAKEKERGQGGSH